MTSPASPPRERLIPESAPFSAEQRDWLDGFFAGLLSLDGVLAVSAAAEVSALASGAAAETRTSTDPLDDGDDGAAPWHDQCLPLEERMRLAEGRPLRRRLMAAMAQQDCGQCGYNCQDYANAIFLGNENRTNLCVPGGKPTGRMLNRLLDEGGAGVEVGPGTNQFRDGEFCGINHLLNWRLLRGLNNGSRLFARFGARLDRRFNNDRHSTSNLAL